MFIIITSPYVYYHCIYIADFWDGRVHVRNIKDEEFMHSQRKKRRIMSNYLDYCMDHFRMKLLFFETRYIELNIWFTIYFGNSLKPKLKYVSIEIFLFEAQSTHKKTSISLENTISINWTIVIFFSWNWFSICQLMPMSIVFKRKHFFFKNHSAI